MPFALHECCHIENSVGLHRKQLLCDCYHNRHRALNHTGSTDMLSPACDDLCISGTAVVWQQTFLNYNDNSQLSFMISVTLTVNGLLQGLPSSSHLELPI